MTMPPTPDHETGTKNFAKRMQHTSAPIWPSDLPAARFASRIRTDSPQGCGVALIGLADDLGVRLNHGRTGAANGPGAFRAALAKYGIAEPHGWEYPAIFDAGDIIPAVGDTAEALHQTHERISAATAALLDLGLFPIAIGGGHDLTFAFVRAVIAHWRGKGDAAPWGGVYFDAHLDVRETVGSGMPVRRLIEECGVERLDAIGINPLVNTKEHVDWFMSHGGSINPDLDELLVVNEHHRAKGWNLFTSFDLDAVDAAHAPGVSALNVCGMSAAMAESHTLSAGACPLVRCFDIMELSPPHDPDARTARLAAHLFLTFLRGFAQRSSRKTSGLRGGVTVVDCDWPSRKLKRKLLIRGARVLTLAASANRPRRGKEMGDLGILPRADILIEDGLITGACASEQTPLMDPTTTSIINADGRVVCPAFIDCHTHLCYAGSRVDEWSQRLAGVAYLDILKAGGGIMATVRSVRAASEEELKDLLYKRLLALFDKSGTLTVEVKSGYGLSTRDELKMLRAIAACAAVPDFQGRVFATALLGHAIDPDESGFVNRVITETLPAITKEFRGIAVDAFCEQGAWPLADCLRLFHDARAAGHPCRVHADQFNDLGMTRLAAARGFVSVDHLEASLPNSLRALAASGTVGVGLPMCGLHMADGKFANLRSLIDFGGACAIASNCNPGSAPGSSMPLVMGAAVRHCKLTPAEAIVGATVNAAHVLGLADRGTIEPGQRADLLVLNTRDERSLAHDLGGDPILHIIRGGEVRK